MRPIIDCHCHIYPDEIASRAVAGIGAFYQMPLLYDGTLRTLRQVGGSAGVTRYVVFSVATKPEQVASINRFIADEVRANPDVLTGLGTLHPDSQNIEEELEQLLALGLKGVKLHPDIQGFKLDDYRCLHIYELCEGRLPILVHTGDSRFDLSNPNRLKPILEIYRNLTVVGAHLGGWSVWKEAAHKLSGFPNFYVDCSSSLYSLPQAEAREIIRRYGADHVLFGTDYPMWSPQEELLRLYALGLTDQELDLILYRNAERLFGISKMNF